MTLSSYDESGNLVEEVVTRGDEEMCLGRNCIPTFPGGGCGLGGDPPSPLANANLQLYNLHILENNL